MKSLLADILAEMWFEKRKMKEEFAEKKHLQDSPVEKITAPNEKNETKEKTLKQ